MPAKYRNFSYDQWKTRENLIAASIKRLKKLFIHNIRDYWHWNYKWRPEGRPTMDSGGIDDRFATCWANKIRSGLKWKLLVGFLVEFLKRLQLFFLLCYRLLRQRPEFLGKENNLAKMRLNEFEKPTWSLPNFLASCSVFGSLWCKVSGRRIAHENPTKQRTPESLPLSGDPFHSRRDSPMIMYGYLTSYSVPKKMM